MKFVTEFSVMSRPLRVGQGFNPAVMFDGAATGVWFDPADRQSLFQDAAGTIPVTAPGQPVARMTDKSGNGNHATQSTIAARPIYREDAVGRGYLEFDGIDDRLNTPTITPGTSKMQLFAGFRKLTEGGNGILCELGSGSTPRSFLVSAPTSNAANAVNYLYRPDSGLVVNTVNDNFPLDTPGVLAATCDLAVSTSTTRIDGAPVLTVSSGLTAPQFNAGVLYIGGRASATLPFSGQLFGMAIRFGSELGLKEIAGMERYLSARLGGTA